MLKEPYSSWDLDADALTGVCSCLRISSRVCMICPSKVSSHSIAFVLMGFGARAGWLMGYSSHSYRISYPTPLSLACLAVFGCSSLTLEACAWSSSSSLSNRQRANQTPSSLPLSQQLVRRLAEVAETLALILLGLRPNPMHVNPRHFVHLMTERHKEAGGWSSGGVNHASTLDLISWLGKWSLHFRQRKWNLE